MRFRGEQGELKRGGLPEGLFSGLGEMTAEILGVGGDSRMTEACQKNSLLILCGSEIRWTAHGGWQVGKRKSSSHWLDHYCGGNFSWAVLLNRYE